MKRLLSAGSAVFFFLTLVAVSSTHLYAQATATISGTVTDTSGAAIPAADLQITNTGTAISQNVQSDDQGRYRVPDLIIGDYQIRASKMGFSTVVRAGITLTVGASPVVDLQMTVGQQATTVTVEAAASQVETQNTSVSSLVEEKQMVELPLNGRNFTQLVALNPAVTQIPQGQTGAGSTFMGNGTKYTFAGSRPDAGSAFLLDNQDMVNFWDNGPGAGGLGTALGVEAIAEFQVLTGSYGPQFGGNGSVVNSSSHPGTNQLHGSLYEFLRNDKLEARNFFDSIRLPGTTAAKPPAFRQNQFGGSVGGPIKKDKLFFFANYEGLRQAKGTSAVVTVPDGCAQRFLTTLSTGACGSAVVQNSNPQVAQAIRNVMAIFPAPAYVPEVFAASGAASGTGQAIVQDPLHGSENYVLGRVDYRLSDKISLFVRYVLDYGTRNTAAGIPYWPEYDVTHDHFVSVSMNQIVSQNIVSTFHVGFSRTFDAGYDYGSPGVSNGVVSAGYISQPPYSSISAGVHPLQSFSSDPTSLFYSSGSAGYGLTRDDATLAVGSGVTGLGPVTTLPFSLVPNKYQIGDDVVWTHSAHTISLGFGAIHYADNTWEPFIDGGAWSFANLSGFEQGVTSNLQGTVSNAQNPGQDDSPKDYRFWDFALYAGDQWKVNNKLTVNYGLRYAPQTMISMIDHKAYALLNAPYGNYVPVNTVFAKNPSLRNFDPRVGIAYDPFADHKTSIRASFGAYHEIIDIHDTLYTLAPPYLSATQTNTSTPAVQFPFPFTNVPAGTGVVVSQNGSLICTNCTYYSRNTTPYAMQWSFSVQHEFWSNALLTVTYTGSRGVHLPTENDFNAPIAQCCVAGRQYFGVFNGSNAVVANPRPNPAFNYLALVDGLADSSYEGLQNTLVKRFSHGWQGQAGWTWSKSIDNSSGSYGGGGGTLFSDPINWHLDRGLSSFNRTTNIRVSGIYTVPFTKAGFVGQLINGWQINNIYTYLSGAPVSVGTLANRGYSGSSGASAVRPDAVAGCNLYTNVTAEQAAGGQPWFNAGCFTPGPVGTVGNAGRNTIIGPTLFALDTSVAKTWRVTKLSEQFAIQFRAEAFNILNHPTFQNPSTTPFNAALTAAVNPATSGGCPTTALAACGVSLNGSSGLITATNSQPRQVQLALKITF
jgi:hypothetical protein